MKNYFHAALKILLPVLVAFSLESCCGSRETQILDKTIDYDTTIHIDKTIPVKAQGTVTLHDTVRVAGDTVFVGGDGKLSVAVTKKNGKQELTYTFKDSIHWHDSIRWHDKIRYRDTTEIYKKETPLSERAGYVGIGYIGGAISIILLLLFLHKRTGM